MDLVDLSPGLRRAIVNPDRKISVELMVPMDNGGVEIFMAHRVQHNNSRGPFKGCAAVCVWVGGGGGCA